MPQGINISSGIGTGEAQVFEKTPVDYIGKIAELKYKQQQEKKAKTAGLQKSLAELDKINIFHKHQPLFQKKQKELYDYVNTNIDDLIKGEPGKTMEFQEMVQNFYNDANLSKGVKDSYKAAAGLVAKDPYKYRQTTVDYLNNFTGYDEETGQFTDIDPVQFKENVDYSEHVLKDLAPVAKTKGEKGGGEYYDAAQGGWVKYDKKKFTPNESYKLIYEDVMNNPLFLDQATYEYNQLAPEEKSQYKDPADYFARLHGNALTFDASKFEITPETGVDQYTVDDIIQNPQDVNIESGEQETTFTTYGKIQHKSPYKVNMSISPQWVNKQGNVKMTAGKNVAVDLAETMLVPYLKKKPVATKEKGQKGVRKIGTDIEQDLVLSGENLKEQMKLGNVEWRVGVTGLIPGKQGEEGTSVIIPADEVENVLKKKGVPVDILKKQAEDLNKSTAPKAEPTGLPKKGDTKTLKSGATAVYDGKQWKLKE